MNERLEVQRVEEIGERLGLLPFNLPYVVHAALPPETSLLHPARTGPRRGIKTRSPVEPYHLAGTRLRLFQCEGGIAQEVVVRYLNLAFTGAVIFTAADTCSSQICSCPSIFGHGEP